MPAEAIAEAPTTPEVHADAPVTPVGELYEQALAKEQGKEEKPVAEPTEPKKATPEPAKDEPVVEKPKSAIEAALSEQPAKKEEGGFKVKITDLPENLPNENRKDHWGRARTGLAERDAAIAEREKTIGELKTQLGTAKDNPEVQAKLQKLSEENATLRDAITAANVELLPEFRAKYIDGAHALVVKAQEKMKAYGGDSAALAEALKMPEGLRREQAIAEAMGENISDLGKAKINNIIAEYDKLQDDAQAERANSQQSYERLTAKQQEQRAAQEQEIATRRQQTFETVSKKLQSEVPTLRMVDETLEGAEDWNNGVKSAFDKAPTLFENGIDPVELATVAVKGLDYDRVTGLLSTAWKDNAQLKKQLAEFDGAQPDVKGGKAPVKTGAEANMERSPGEIFRETMQKLSNNED